MSRFAPKVSTQLRQIIDSHQLHPRSLLDDESTDACNEEAARAAFGDEFLDQLKSRQARFRGDWWQLALLIKELDTDGTSRDIRLEHRLLHWHLWRSEQRCRWETGEFEYVHLENVELRGMHLEHADLWRAHLEHADLFDAHLEFANLRWAHLRRANLRVRAARGLLFSDNRYGGIHIYGNAPDPWSVLRRKYTGPWFFVHLALLAVFFAPYVGRAIYYTAAGRAQDWSLEQYQKLGGRLEDAEQFQRLHQEARQRFEETHERHRAVWIVLGWERGWWALTMALIVIVYNVLRAVLTVCVSMLREAEERSQTTPRLFEYYGRCHPLSGVKWYTFRGCARVHRETDTRLSQNPLGVLRLILLEAIGLYRLHVFARLLLLLALISVAINTYSWAVQTWIWVPVSA
jgi:hypothetical protein